MNFIILTGGTSKRFGSDKSKAEIAGQTLLEILYGNLPEGKVIIVGPKTNLVAEYVQEQPLHAGPLAALGAGMQLVDTDLVAVFATDMPFAPKLLPRLLIALSDDAALAKDVHGQLQPFAGVYRSKPLINALNSYSTLVNQSMKSLLEKLKVNQVPLVETNSENENLAEYLIDIDTPEALTQAIALKSRLGL